MPNIEPQELIRRLGLQPHPAEGGFFVETYRAAEQIAALALPPWYGADRYMSTCIFYLLTSETISALHRLQSDEIFHFYLGDAVEMLQLYPDGRGERIVLGHNILAGQRVQQLVPRGVWQGSRLMASGKWALLGCTVAPGFDYADYEHGSRERLIEQYPEWVEQIRLLTNA